MLQVAPPAWRRRGFTLIEITIVIFLIMLILAVAMPSFSGQRLQSTFDKFDALALAAQKASIGENKPYVIVWTKDGSIALYPAELTIEQRRKQGSAMALHPAGSPERATGHFSLVRSAALSNNPVAVWTFWPTGNCEPVTVRYEGPEGQWEASYNPLSAKGTINSFIAR